MLVLFCWTRWIALLIWQLGWCLTFYENSRTHALSQKEEIDFGDSMIVFNYLIFFSSTKLSVKEKKKKF